MVWLMDGSSSKEQKLGSKNSAPKTDLGSCRYFNARHLPCSFSVVIFFATWNLRPNLPAESKITKAFQTNFLLMCMADTQTRTYQTIIGSRSVVIIELDNQELLLQCIFVCKSFQIFFYATRCRLNNCCQSNAVSIVYPKGMKGR